MENKTENKIQKLKKENNNLILNKYRNICAQELTAFYDPTSRINLEKIIEEKFNTRSKEFFTFGSLDEEIKKIAKIAGVKHISICDVDESSKILMSTANSKIIYSISNQNDKLLLNKIGKELKDFLESKKYTKIAEFIDKLLENKPFSENDLIEIQEIYNFVGASPCCTPH